MAPTRWHRLALAAFAMAWLVACGPAGSSPADDDTGMLVSALAGPTCPVERVPPDPACGPRPVAGAEVRISTPDGAEVSRVRLDDAGRASVVIGPGDYLVEGLPVRGLMGTPSVVRVTVVADTVVPVALMYDTGIR